MDVLFYQKIISLVTETPLFVFGQSGNRKSGVISGEGLWRWRLVDFRVTGSHNTFNKIINSVIQYLALDAERKRFHVLIKRQFLENENILFRAELYDENFEFLPGKDISLSLTDEAGNAYDFTFDKSEKGYELNAGKFSHGVYQYEAAALLGDNVLVEEGSFSVRPVDFESLSVKANHRVLYQLSQSSGGTMLYPEEINDVVKIIKEKDNIRSVVYSKEKYTEMVNLSWVLLLLLLFLSAEWIGRKWGGSY